MILVVGATGQVGTAVVRKLVADGRPARAFVRRTSNYQHLQGLGVELAFGDLRDPASLETAAHGISAVYLNLPTSTNPRAAFIPEQHGVANVLRVLPRDVLILKLSEIAVGEQAAYHDLALKTEAEVYFRRKGLDAAECLPKLKILSEAPLAYSLFMGAALWDYVDPLETA